LISEVAEASKEQSQGIGQITAAMGEMDKVTQSNAASAEQSASEAGQLSLQAGNLLNAVDEMKALAHGDEARSHHGGPAAPPPPAPAAKARSKNPKVLPMDDQF
jgi:methyl-accepting chemotaxis protein